MHPTIQQLSNPVEFAIHRPHYTSVPLEKGLRWRGGGDFLYTEKKDGVWALKEVGTHSTASHTLSAPSRSSRPSVTSCLLEGELMPDGTFHAFDLWRIGHTDLRCLPLHQRWIELNRICVHLCPSVVKIVPSGNGAEFLETILARGGEGIVASPWQGCYGTPRTKCKRCETYDLLVIDKDHYRASLILAEPVGTRSTASQTPRGKCPAKAAFDQIRIGDIVEIAAMGLTSRGLLREPRFLRLRHDKANNL